MESMEQEHGLGANDITTSVSYARENTHEQKGRDLSLKFVNTQLNKSVLYSIIKSLHLLRNKGIFILGIPLLNGYESETRKRR